MNGTISGQTVESRRGPAVAGLVGAAGFALSYLASDRISSVFATAPAPQPNVSGEVTQAWLAGNAMASVVQSVMMVISVVFLAVFVASVATITRRSDGSARRVAIAAGTASVLAMVASSVLAWALSATAAGLTPEAVAGLRTASFVTGGTVHVALLGLFALAVSRIPGMSKPIRIFAIVLAVIAIGSLLSLAIYNAAILILAGRLLGMIWCILAAISLLRRALRPPVAL